MKPPSSFPEVSYSEWRRRVERELGPEGFEGWMMARAEGIEFEALCTAEHPRRSEPRSLPGGPQSRHSNGELPWLLCQRFDHHDPRTLNHFLKSDLRHGVSGIWLLLDRAARQGEDPTDRRPEAGGLDGAELRRIEDVAEAFEEVPSSWTTLLLDAGGCFLPAAAMLRRWLEESSIGLDSRVLLWGADPLGTLARDGTLPASLDKLWDDLATLTERSREWGSGSRAIAVNSLCYREAGAELDQELGISLATGAEVLRELSKRGVGPARVGEELVLVTGTGQQIFPEIAKIRALRILWDHMLRACDVEPAATPWIHASTLRRSLGVREPSINLLRGTTAGWAAIIGGADSIEIPPHDDHSGEVQTEKGRRLARNTAAILGLEAHLNHFLDPAAGSYLLESITHQLVERGWSEFREIEARGGLRECLETGRLSEAIDSRWRDRSRRIREGIISLTGENVYVRDGSVTDDGLATAPEHRGQRPQRERSDRSAYGDGGPAPMPVLPSESDRWQWCLEAVAANRSFAEMRLALYAADRSPLVSRLPARRDSSAVDRTGKRGSS